MSRTTPASNTHEPELRTVTLNLTPEQFQTIREAYFQHDGRALVSKDDSSIDDQRIQPSP